MKENFGYNTYSKKTMAFEFFLFTMAFHRNICIQCPFKEIFVYIALLKKIMYTTPFKKELYTKPFKKRLYTKKKLCAICIQRNFCVQYPFKEMFVYNALSKKILFATPFQRNYLRFHKIVFGLILPS